MPANQTTSLSLVDAFPASFSSDHSLLEIDREIDLLLDQIQDELEETGEVSESSRATFLQLCECFGEKVDRIGKFVRVMESRAAYCKSEASRLAARAKVAENKVGQIKSLVLYFPQVRGLTKLEGPQFTLRCQRNSADTVNIRDTSLLPMHLFRVEARFDGALWQEIAASLSPDLQRGFLAALQASSPVLEAIKQEILAGNELPGVNLSRGQHLRVT